MSSVAGWWQRVRDALGMGVRPDERPGRRRAQQGDFVQALIDGLLHHDNPDVRAGAARKLGELAPAAGSRGVDALVRALRDDDAGVRSSAALSLGEYGSEASGCVGALIEALADADDDVRSSAGIALEDIGCDIGSEPADAVKQALTKALQHGSPLVRAEAEVLLQRLGEQEA